MSWLSVKSIYAGLFESEYVVELTTVDGDLQLFMAKHHVDTNKRAISISVLDQDERHALVEIPSQDGRITTKILNNLLNCVV